MGWVRARACVCTHPAAAAAEVDAATDAAVALRLSLLTALHRIRSR